MNDTTTFREAGDLISSREQAVKKVNDQIGVMDGVAADVRPNVQKIVARLFSPPAHFTRDLPLSGQIRFVSVQGESLPIRLRERASVI